MTVCKCGHFFCTKTYISNAIFYTLLNESLVCFIESTFDLNLANEIDFFICTYYLVTANNSR